MKKIFSKCLTAVAAVSLLLSLTMFVSAAGAPTMEVQFEKDTYAAGDIVTAQVYVKGVEYNTIGFSLKYDTQVMKPVTATGADSDKVLQLVGVNELYDGVNETGYYVTNACAADLSAGTLKVNMYVSPGLGNITADDSGRLLATIRFKMVKDGRPELQFATLAGDVDFANQTCYAYLNGKGPEFTTKVVYLQESGEDDDQAVRAVEAMIDAIAGSSDRASAVAQARSAYDALTETQKALVGNYDVLTAAEAALDKDLTDVKAEAKAGLDAYKNPDNYRDAQKEELAAGEKPNINLYFAGKNAIDSAKTLSEVEKAVSDAKAAMDAIKTDAELTGLETAKEKAKEELGSYKNEKDYRDAQKKDLAAAIENGKSAIDNAKTLSDVQKALDDAKAAMDAIKTDAQLTAEENAAKGGSKAPQTGDSTAVLPVAMLLAALLGGAGLVVTKLAKGRS